MLEAARPYPVASSRHRKISETPSFGRVDDDATKGVSAINPDITDAEQYSIQAAARSDGPVVNFRSIAYWGLVWVGGTRRKKPMAFK